MNYNKKIKAFRKSFVEDGMGGGSYQLQALEDDIKCSIPPIKRTIIEAGGREEEHNILKVFTREPIVGGDDLIFEYLGQRYKLCSWCDYGKVFLYEMEVL